VEVQPFTPDHLDGVLRLCIAENWPSFPADPERAQRILTAPGVTTVVALEDHAVLGFAELFSDGELQTYLANLAVDAGHRRRGIARAMIETALRLAGGERVDLLSEDAATGFYRQLPNFPMTGFRLYPFHNS